MPSKAKPFLKWVGGKARLAGTLADLLPDEIDTYYEAFTGGGALFFHLAQQRRFRRAVLNDFNPELVNCYAVIRDDVDGLVRKLRGFALGRDAFYEIRALDPNTMPPVDRAARTIYLNKTCFTSGAQVLRDDETWTSIENLKVGDRLWNGRRVHAKLARQFFGTIRRINVQGSPFTLSVTSDHPILAVPGKGSARQEKRTPSDLLAAMTLLEAQQLKAGDYVFLPTAGSLVRAVDWRRFWPAVSTFGPQARRTRFSVDAVTDHDIARLLGYYAAEGHIVYQGSRRRIKSAVWTFNTDEKETYVADVVDICTRLFNLAPTVSPSVVPGKQTLSVELHSVFAAHWIQTLVPGKSWAKEPAERKTKRLHPMLMTAPADVQLEVLKGWLRGDGGVRVRRATNSTELYGTCTVLPLARQFYRLAQRCGLKPSWRVSYPGGNETAIVYFSGDDVATLGFGLAHRTRASCNQRRRVGPYLAVRIREIVDLAYDGVVHNVEVDGDRLICVDGVVSHNCFNGLYRQNKRGEFNAPFGDYANPQVVDEPNLRACSALLQSVRLRIGDFAQAVEDAASGDAVYFDPPYVPLTATSNFKSYTKEGFTLGDQQRLATTCRELTAKGVFILESNSDTATVHNLYEDFERMVVRMRRNINATASGRGPVNELVIMSRQHVRDWDHRGL